MKLRKQMLVAIWNCAILWLSLAHAHGSEQPYTGDVTLSLAKDQWGEEEEISGIITFQIRPSTGLSTNHQISVWLNGPRIAIRCDPPLFPRELFQVEYSESIQNPARVGTIYQIPFKVGLDKKLCSGLDVSLPAFPPGKHRLKFIISSPFSHAPQRNPVDLFGTYESVWHPLEIIQTPSQTASPEKIVRQMNIATPMLRGLLAEYYAGRGFPLRDLDCFSALGGSLEPQDFRELFFKSVNPSSLLRVHFGPQFGVSAIKLFSQTVSAAQQSRVNVPTPEREGVYRVTDQIRGTLLGWLLVRKDRMHSESIEQPKTTSPTCPEP